MRSQPWGGSEYLWVTAADRALLANHDVMCVVYSHARNVPKLRALAEKGVRVLLQQNVCSKGLVTRLASRFVARIGIQRYPPWVRELEAFMPDLVCISQGNTYDILNNRTLLEWVSRSGVPRVHICHLNSVFHVPSDWERRAARSVFSTAAGVGFVSVDNLKAAERQLAMSLPNTRILRNPVNLRNYEEGALWVKSDHLKMAVVARLDVRYKGHDLLIQALSSETWKERKWSLEIYGEGPDREYIAEMLEYFGLSKNIHLCGHVNDVASIWAKNHVLVLPSRAEGTPLALVEAMLMGRPALVTDVGGNAEWITERVNGFVAEGVSDRSLASALDRLWANRNSLQAMGDNARAFALSNIDEDPGGTLLRLLERSLLQKPKSSSAFVDTTTF